MCTERERRGSGSTLQGSANGELQASGSVFDVSRVNRALAGSIFQGKLHHFKTIDSTQVRALADAQSDASGGQVYVADEQTAGRGRGGHTWHSEPDNGLYLTALVRPVLRGTDALAISLAAGIAAQTAIYEVSGLRIDLRWPNDLVTMGPHSRKLGGILTESAMQADGRMRYAAIGIGVNLNQTAIPPELQVVSTSLRLITGATISRELLLIALLRRLEAELAALTASSSDVLARFAESSSWARGKLVRVAEGEGYTGVTVGLTDAGLLRVRCDDGRERLVRHGGVRELS